LNKHPSHTEVLPVRVYYEDTDAAGIVYYANYLRFIERGRTEFLRTFGHDQNQLMKEGVAFAVRSVAAEYLKPARLDDSPSPSAYFGAENCCLMRKYALPALIPPPAGRYESRRPSMRNWLP
jgi:hypothetical protein